MQHVSENFVRYSFIHYNFIKFYLVNLVQVISMPLMLHQVTADHTDFIVWQGFHKISNFGSQRLPSHRNS